MSDITSEVSGKSLFGWSLNDWGKAYRNGGNASALLSALLAEVRQQESTAGSLNTGSVWIKLASEQQLGAQLIQLQQLLDAADGDMQALPLYGVPFAVKDNIDVAGFSTTAACPEFAYEPQADATVVRLLRNARCHV